MEIQAYTKDKVIGWRPNATEITGKIHLEAASRSSATTSRSLRNRDDGGAEDHGPLPSMVHFRLNLTGSGYESIEDSAPTSRRRTPMRCSPCTT